MKCPQCLSGNPPDAERCGCGYAFRTAGGKQPVQQTRRSNPLLGGLVGALIGGVARLVVALSFLHYVSHRGGWWRGAGEELSGLVIISAVVGLVAGGAGGATCRPTLGA